LILQSRQFSHNLLIFLRADNLLDIILADDDQIINSVTADPPMGHSDHAVIKFTIGLELNSTVVNIPAETVRHDWSKANFEAMQVYL